MQLRQYLATARYITTNTARPFAWGDWDCNLFAIDLLDLLWPIDQARSLQVRGKYNSLRGARRFQRGFTPAPKWFEQQGMQLIQVHSDQFQNLDMIFRPARDYWHMSLWFAGRSWAVIEDRGLMVDVVEPGEYLIVRKNG